MLKFKIRLKLLFLLLAVSLLPLGLLDLYWFNLTQNFLKKNAAYTQNFLTYGAVYRVNQFMNDTVNALIIHSQAANIEAFNINGSIVDLTALIKQDNDIQSLILANSSGKVVVAMNRQGLLNTNYNVASYNAFRAATFLAGKEYIGQVKYNNQKQPTVTIGIPLVNFNKGQNLTSLSTANNNGTIRTPNQIKGVLIAQVSLANLWKSVLANRFNSADYIYVVSSQGSLISYPNNNFLEKNKGKFINPIVSAFLKNPAGPSPPIITTTEKGMSVLGSYRLVPRTNWGVIIEEPLSEVYASAYQVETIGIIIFISVAVLMLLINYLVSRQFTIPIKKLTEGASSISQGKLDTKITIRSKDELGSLAQSFNNMASNLSVILNQARAESSKVGVMLNNVGEGILAVDINGIILVSNTAAAVLIGTMPKDIVGQNFKNLYLFSKDNQQLLLSFQEIKVYKDLVLTTANKRIHYVDLLLNPIINDPSGIKTIITIIDNTSEQELDNMKVDFVSMAAHELRTPMTAIRGYIDLIMHTENLNLPISIVGFLQHIQASSTQLIGLINNLLNVSRIERNALNINLQRLNWQDIVKKSISDQQFTAKAKSINLYYNGLKSSVYIMADQIAIAEVINNLICNAINYTPNNGWVKIDISLIDNKVITTIADNGIGISEENQKHLFTKFYRVKSGLTSGSGGTGLGLYISKSIIDYHHGSITVKSTEGQGSKFIIKLPIVDPTSYNEANNKSNVTYKQRHGWITKNTTSRR